ncbi:unnamed protein product [Blepharisma stoltei]|uniref:Ycf15 n=1 Tax=Blepharisma stoltei TaxID=1481888 RepID=A0AAU9JA82_9CILI|nr:unnamed protein product [Blepharisma stoltei]
MMRMPQSQKRLIIFPGWHKKGRQIKWYEGEVLVKGLLCRREADYWWGGVIRGAKGLSWAQQRLMAPNREISLPRNLGFCFGSKLPEVKTRKLFSKLYRI